jgi:hypothetical protein
MSSVSFISGTQSFAAATSGKYAAQQSAPAQSRPAASGASSVTISSSALYANYAQTMAEGAVGQKQTIDYFLANPTSPLAEKSADVMAHENLLGGSIGGSVSIAGTTPNDPISYSNGEPVTAASQAYYTKQAGIYMEQVRELYDTELAMGTKPGEIISKIYGLRASQPDALRAMMGFQPVAGPSSIRMASNPHGAPEQYLNAGGQAVKA